MGRKSRKRQIAEEQSAYLAQRRREEAGTIATRYPHVRTVALELTFVDPDGLAETVTEALTREPKLPALFVFDCPYRECVGGGHDIDDAIDRALMERTREASGTHVCRGWQDASRIGKHRCQGEMRYVIGAEFVDTLER